MTDRQLARRIRAARREPTAPRRERPPMTQVEVGERRRAATRAVMLDAAFDLLGRTLGRNIRVEEVCAKAEVVRTTFYNHFDGIEQLMSALGDELSHSFNSAVHHHTRQLPSIAEQVATAVRLYLHRAEADASWGRAMVNLSLAATIMGHETHAIIEQDIADGIAAGVFQVTSCRLGADIVHGLGFAAMISILEGIAPAGYAEQVAKLILLALGVSAVEAQRIVSVPLPQF